MQDRTEKASTLHNLAKILHPYVIFMYRLPFPIYVFASIHTFLSLFVLIFICLLSSSQRCRCWNGSSFSEFPFQSCPLILAGGQGRKDSLKSNHEIAENTLRPILSNLADCYVSSHLKSKFGLLAFCFSKTLMTYGEFLELWNQNKVRF